MERAKPHEIGPAFLQLHVAADDVDHVSACQQLLNKGLGNGHGESGVCGALFAHHNAFAPRVGATEPYRSGLALASGNGLQATGHVRLTHFMPSRP